MADSGSTGEDPSVQEPSELEVGTVAATSGGGVGDDVGGGHGTPSGGANVEASAGGFINEPTGEEINTNAVIDSFGEPSSFENNIQPSQEMNMFANQVGNFDLNAA